MRHGFGSCVLVISVLFCLLTTWSSATAPGGFAQRLGLAVVNAAGSNEIRAQYAGFFFAVAVVCAAALAGAVSRQSGYLVLAVVFGGLIAGRLVSLVLNGGIAGYTPTILALYAIDSLGFVLAVTAIAVDSQAYAGM
jgi:energy-converting hydrogenase Eha subunit B